MEGGGVIAPGFAPASRGGGAGIKDAARRLRRSPAAILDAGTAAARAGCVAGTKERRFSRTKERCRGSGFGERAASALGGTAAPPNPGTELQRWS